MDVLASHTAKTSELGREEVTVAKIFTCWHASICASNSVPYIYRAYVNRLSYHRHISTII
jgi:hypothetical protein